MAGHVQPPHGSDRLRDPDNTSAADHQAAGIQTDQVKSGEFEQSARVISSGILQYIRTDIGAFLLTSGVLSIFDSIRDETKALLDKGESWRLSMLKHSTPLSADYFFKNDNAADRVTFLGVIVNLLLSAGKFGVGVACHSSALIADAGHSLSDLFSDFVTLWAVQVARLPPDDDHPYGHGKFESVGSLFLSLTLLGTGLSVGLSSYIKFLTVVSTQRTLGVAAAAKLVEVPTWPALVMALLSILSKEWLYRITRRVGENLNSQVVIANAWHHRSDAYSSVLALVSIGLAMTVPSFLASDSAAGILVAGMIALTGAEILGESIRQLTDAVIDEDMVEQIKIKSAEDADVLKVTKARARQVGSSALVDIEVEVPAQLSSSAMRAIEERIRVRIKSEVDGNILGVEVKAVAQDEVFCPLLTAVVESDSDLNTSAIEIEEQARGRLDSHPGVLSANKVTIHYVDTVMVRVDANICMDRSINTLKEANELAVILRDELLDSDKCIVEANIFLDLNEMSGQEKAKVLQP
ncbi:hypothetical protein THAOC_01484 [Thalassiosira oceanica]|uniref:Uncharacterized protein n=1 Tax=Thalassiosira oceanica TaxID=159749 RepID=K0TIB1_THAOC|nr:hypothetical protein THAOC_01484 [Thalassiosira oceanica]|eukprot:EJK76734.1 hypothetical protein THAOC_01484 [Thalassiosira oceanica]